MTEESSLKVSESLMKNRWVFQKVDDDKVERIMQVHSLPEIVARLLVARNVDVDSVDSFLYPKISKHFPDPMSLKDMPEFAKWAVDNIQAGKKIGLFGDFDVDGSTSTAIFIKFFRALGLETPFHIPDRLTEGYGPNINALAKLKEQGCDIIFIADCGTTSFDVVEQGRALGLDIVIFDHHQAEETLPDANFIINPKRNDDDSGLDMLCAATVCFLACVAMNTEYRARGLYKGKQEPPLKDWLDLIAMATVCDMVPLTGPNRLFVQYGLQKMQHTENIGLKALCEISSVRGLQTTMNMGFGLGPRINAGSRVHQADLGAKLLSSIDGEEALNIAWTLNDCNEKRKEIQAQMMQEALGQVAAGDLDRQELIFIADEGWHAGLSGLVAGQVKERFGKPTVCVTFAKNEKGELEGRGSGRSIPGVNMAAAFIDARNEGIIIKGGGHAMAGGFTVEPDKIPALQAFLNKHVQDQLNGAPINPEKQIDAMVSVGAAQLDFVKLIEAHGGPYGQGNPEPMFAIPNARVQRVDIVGKNHVRCYISDIEGGRSIKAMAFGAVGTPLGKALLEQSHMQNFHLLGQFKANEWQGRESVDFFIKDAAFSIVTEQSIPQEKVA
ncbi:MAG: single-stranded-DNA-specific exonuclease RecJ [Alphaproteobacteria bacterium]|nr:single-stranded-DNA-specific exonuclease RecJ [Alphaproteobacteria bacterium]